jgi:pSer/pThr/pTyr-binding forkhead associated (FHA) protein
MRFALRFLGYRAKDGTTREHGLTGQVFAVPDGGLTIGRGRDTEIRIPDGSVARAHVRVRADGDRLIVCDLQSTNGTFVNGTRVPPSPTDGVQCRAGDILTLAMGYELEIIEVAS